MQHETLESRNIRLRKFVRRTRGMSYGLKNKDIAVLIGATDKDRGKRWNGKYNITKPELDKIEEYLNRRVGEELTDWNIDRVIKMLAKGRAANRKENYNI